MTDRIVSRMPKTVAERGRHRTRPGQPHVRPEVPGLQACAGTGIRAPRHARVVADPRPVIPYRRLEGAARTVTHVFLAAAAIAAVLLVGDLSTPDRPVSAQQRVEWVAR